MPAIQLLPPRTSEAYAARARKGDWEYCVKGIYIWFIGNQKVSLISLEPPQGHVVQYTTAEANAVKRGFERYRNPNRKETTLDRR